MKYAIKVSPKNLGASIHGNHCRVVINRSPRDNVHTVEGASAAQVRIDWDIAQDVAARGLPVTKICGCCK